MASNETALKSFLSAYGITPTGDVGAAASKLIAERCEASAKQREELFGSEAAAAAEKLRFVASKFAAKPELAYQLPVIRYGGQ